MSEKMYLNLLLLCGIFSQGIIETFADKDMGNSSDILMRQKRVINAIPGEHGRVSIRDAPYVVSIKYNNRIICVGSIMSPHVVITITACVQYTTTIYKVGSNSARVDAGHLHSVVDIKKYFIDTLNRPLDGIALLAIHPAFVRGTSIDFIQMHTGLLLPGTIGIVSGWGCNPRGSERGTDHSRSLRSIEVPIMAHQNCINRYRPHNIPITDKNICTFHPQKYCGHIDGGAPLVIDGFLAGIHLWTGPNQGEMDPQYPDVFAVMQHSTYSQWIRSTIINIETISANQHY